MIKNPRRLDGEEIKPVSLSIDLNITPLSTATLTLPAGEQIAPRTYIELFALPGSMGVFRARSPQMGAAMNTTVQLDHAIAEVGDSLFVGDVEQESTVSSAMTAIWGHYKGARWQLGSVAGGSTAVVLKASYDTVLDAILDVLEQAPNLMLTYDFTTIPWTVSVAQRETTVTAEGRLSRNVKSASVTVDDSDLYTRVYMDKLPGTSGNTYGHIDADTIGTYGVIETELSGAETTAQATRIANAYLEKHKNPIYSVDIEGIDLSQITGETLDSFALGRKYRLALPKYGVVVEETITAIRYTNVYGSPKSISITLSEEADQVISYIKKAGKGGRANSKAIIKQKKEYITRFDQTDTYIEQWAGKTDTNGNILQQAGMYLDAHGILQYATDNEKNIGSKFEQTSEMIRTEVSTAVSGIASSVIEQTATYIRTEVQNAASEIAESVIEQTASYIQTTVADIASGVAYTVIIQTMTGIEQRVAARSRVYVQYPDPSLAVTDLRDGDIWIQKKGNSTWNSLAGKSWNEVSNDKWNEFYGAPKYVWKNNAWMYIGDNAQTIESEVEITHLKDLYSILARQIDTEGNASRANLQVTATKIRTDVSTANSTLYSYIDQTATGITSNVEDVRQGMQSQITQTASEIRASVSAARSDLYSTIVQTATNIRSEVASAVSGLQSSIEQTAESITTQVSAAKSTMYSVIQQTATSIRSEVANTVSDLRSSIQQTASSITTQVSAAKSSLYSTIEQTATSIRSEVANTVSDIRSSIEQTASEIRSDVSAANSSIWSSISQTSTQIELKVGKGEVISSINQTAEEITISASKINLSGYVKTSQLNSVDAKIDNLMAGNTTATWIKANQGNIPSLTVGNNLSFKSHGVYWQAVTINGTAYHLMGYVG